MEQEKVKVVFFKLYLTVWLLLLSAGVGAQELNPIRWTIKNESSAVKPGEVFNVQVVAAIDEGWHLYSLEQPAGGPIPTKIFVDENRKFKSAGDIESPQPQVLFDPNFNMDTQFYEGEVVFKVPLQVTNEASTGKNTVSVNAFFQTCNDKTCLPPKIVKLTLEVEVTGGSQPANDSTVSPSQTTPSPAVSNIKSPGVKTIDFDFVDFEGKPRKFSEFKGKIVLLDFWATWCSPCLKDIPKLKVLYDKYQAQGFEIIGMNSEAIGDDEAPDPELAKETAERARQIVKTRQATWTQANSETATPLAKEMFGVKALPTKILIDKDGKIIATIGEKDDLTGIVERLLNEKK